MSWRKRLKDLGTAAKDGVVGAAGAAADAASKLPGAETVSNAVSGAVDYVSGIEVKSAGDKFAAILAASAEKAKIAGVALGDGVVSAASSAADTATSLARNAYELREYARITPGMVEKLRDLRALVQKVLASKLSPGTTKKNLKELKEALEGAKTPNPEHVSAKALNVLLDSTLAVVNRALGFGGPTLISFMLIAVNPQLEILDLVLGIAIGAIDLAGIGKADESGKTDKSDKKD
jgi:hypothetical protein